MKTIERFTNGDTTVECITDSERPTLREQFAMAALTGQCVEFYSPGENNRPSAEWNHANVAKGCYLMADAMLAVREEP